VPAKDHVSASGSQLMDTQPGTVILRCRLEKLNGDWQQMVSALHDSEKEVQAAWMLLLTPRQALDELMLWLQTVEKTLREGSSKSPDSSADVECEQQKYRVRISPVAASVQLRCDFGFASAIPRPAVA